MMDRAEKGGGSSGSCSRPGVGEDTPAFSTRVAAKDYRPQIGRWLLLGLDASVTVAGSIGGSTCLEGGRVEPVTTLCQRHFHSIY